MPYIDIDAAGSCSLGLVAGFDLSELGQAQSLSVLPAEYVSFVCPRIAKS